MATCDDVTCCQWPTNNHDTKRRQEILIRNCLTTVLYTYVMN